MRFGDETFSRQTVDDIWDVGAFIPVRLALDKTPSPSRPETTKTRAEGSGTLVGLVTVTENCAVPSVSEAPLSRPPRIENELKSYVPGSKVGSSNTVKKANGPLVWLGSRDKGKLVRNGVSSTVRSSDEVVELSPFRKTVFVDERFISVASNATDDPAVAVWNVCVRVMPTESARVTAARIRIVSAANTNGNALCRFMFRVLLKVM